jgi:hypothetical protein
MNRKKLEKHLRAQGCELLRHGSKHDLWINTLTHRESAIPRHREIKTGTTLKIREQLGISPPRE